MNSVNNFEYIIFENFVFYIFFIFHTFLEIMYSKLKNDILRAQRKLISIESHAQLLIAEIKEINRRMTMGEAKARRAKKEMVEEQNLLT